MKLKLNPDKTKILITNKPKFDQNLKNFHFYAKEYKIVQKKVIKILGTYIRRDLKLDSEIGKLVGQLHNRIYNIKLITKYTKFKTRLDFLNANVIGKLNYMLPLYMHASKDLSKKF